VRRETGDEHRLDVVTEDKVQSGHEELSWDEFEQTLERDDMVVAHHGDDEYEVLARSDLVHATVASEQAEEALMEGETVESEITERKVVEHTIVQESTIQSEISDRDRIRSDIVAASLRNTDVDHCTVSRTDPPSETPEMVSGFQPGTTVDEEYDVEIEIDEAWDLTREIVERITIESRIVEMDVEETETVESDTLRETVDIEGVTETILEGELVASPESAAQAVEGGHVESRFREDDVIETHLIRRQMIDEEMLVRKEITGSIADAEVLSTDAITHSVVESEIVDESEYDVDIDAGTTSGRTDIPADDTEHAAMPTEEDEGKSVVNAAGDEIGMVVEVDAGRMFVDPHPSLTDRIRTVLGWSGEHDEDAYPVDNEHITRIEDDQVVLGVDEDR
jgi:hypothetical protein